MSLRPTPRRRPPERSEEGRRLHSAGSAVAVSLLALSLGTLLNAPGVRKSATIQPEGWKRDLALAVTSPLATVSSALLLDRPRRALKAALGRSQDDVIDTVVRVPEPPVAGPRGPAPEPKRERFTPERPLRLWIAGDSLAIVPGESLLRAVAGNRAVEPVGGVDARIASGLERPDVFNWFRRVREQMRVQRPHAVVFLVGGNDDHGFMTGLPQGRSLGPFGSARWRAEYARRVGGIMDTVTRAGASLVWIGLPITDDPEQTRRYDVINAVVQAEAARRPRVYYLDTYFFFAGEDGGYTQYVAESSGKLVKMRADDGVHFERPAGDLIARKVLELLERHYEITTRQRRR